MFWQYNVMSFYMKTIIIITLILKLKKSRNYHSIHINFCLSSGNQHLINYGCNIHDSTKRLYILHHWIRYMHHHHLLQYHSRSLPHNQTRNFHFNCLVKTEIH